MLLLAGASSCKSHHKTVVRPSAGQEYHKEPKSVDLSTPAKVKTDVVSDVDVRIGERLVKEAGTWIGTKYKYGGETKSGADCSGMLMTIFYDITKLKLPRNSAAQREYCLEIPRKQLQKGDLVFFSSSKGGSKVSHVGMYVGDGKMIHASTSRGVVTSSLNEKYYETHYHSSGRVYGITYAGLGKTPMVTPSPSTLPNVEEITLDEFVKSHRDYFEDVDTTMAEDKIIAKTIAEIDSATILVDSVKIQKTIMPVDTIPASAATPNDSTKRADEIRDNVTRAMKFGK